MPSDAMHPDRVWSTLPTRRLRAFGAALSPEIDGRLVTPARITTRVRKLHGTPPCPECGNRGPWQCDCPGDEE